tara:strand:- start:420 stop:1124 length:705 start_codon:yes stop_codon:yes gene_type:complete
MSIESRNNVPSANSVKEGQVIIAKDPKKGHALYVKKGSELFSVPLSSSKKAEIFDSITVNGISNFNSKVIANTIHSRNFTYNKFTDYRHFIHNCYDDFGTSKVYLPWGDAAENNTMFKANHFLCPYNKMTLKKILFRPGAVTGDAKYTFTIETAKDGTEDSIIIAQAITKLVNRREDYYLVTIPDSDFTINAPYDDASVGLDSVVGISVQADADPSGSIYWHLTSFWEIEIDIT